MTFPRPDFPDEAIRAAKAHAVACYPNESCGLMVNGIYVPCENAAEDPTKFFQIDPVAIATAGDGLQAVLHSHPDGEAVPSKADMESQIDTDCIFGVIRCNKNEAFEIVYWGDFRLEEPLIGRAFIPGASDCYTLIRAYFWQFKGIKLPEFARDADWWKSGESIYAENFAAAGFTQVPSAEVQEGDVFIGKVRSAVPNHGGVLLANGIGLHHLEGRLSRRESVLPWRRFITHWLRHTGMPEV